VMIVVMGPSAVPGSSRTLVAIAAANAARQQLREIDFGGTKLCRCSGVLAPLQKSLFFVFPRLFVCCYPFCPQITTRDR
jgi:hypothetical protein